ncbi:MAG: DegV family protein [Chloroflexi bacterium]|nr:DegV family protein [Chloroflexota bacterium]
MIKIVADTTAELSPDFVQEHDIPVLPQFVIFGEQSYRDDTELDTPTFLQKLRASTTLPKTAAPPPALYKPIFEKYLAAGDEILVIAPSEDVSGTFRSALTAAQDYPDASITVLDTRSVAGPMGEMVRKAVGWAEAAADMQTILERLHDMMKRTRIYILVDTLDYLYKGGRIGGAQHLVGSLLQIKPLLTVIDGRIEPCEQLRTKKRALERMRQVIAAECPPLPESALCLMHGDAEAEALALAEDLKSTLGLPDVPVLQVPPAIVVHVGPGVIAAGFFS